MVVACFAAITGWMVGTCEVAKMPEYCVEAPTADPQEKHSKPGPLKFVTPPKPCQRPIGTSASNSIASDVLANSSVFGQLISSTPSMVEMAQPRSRLVPKVPSLSLRSLKTGLVLRRSSCAGVIASMTSSSQAGGAYERQGGVAIVAQPCQILSRSFGADYVRFRSELSVPRAIARPRLPCHHEG